jgi:lysophospholipase L1-like esterase
MKYLLCYGDSNTWGHIPSETLKGVFNRYEFDVRWTGVLQKELGADYHIYENGMKGRAATYDDPGARGRCAQHDLPFALDITSPLDLVILMLGGNDTKSSAGLDAIDIANGMKKLIKCVKHSRCGRDGNRPEILIISPSGSFGDMSKSCFRPFFDESSERRIAELPSLFRQLAESEGAGFMDATEYVKRGIDGLHFTPESHANLGRAVAEQIRGMM